MALLTNSKELNAHRHKTLPICNYYSVMVLC